MAVSIPGYNERSWAIDVISEINNYCASRSRAIARAGGEYTLQSKFGNRFPDVLLFGDSSASVLQGWELKMPDTAINDRLLLENAEQKAQRLGLNSFVVWNANEAVLYLQDGSGTFIHKKSWPATNIQRRGDVESNRVAWVNLLHLIIDDLNDLFDHGTINGTRPEAALSDALFLDYLNHYVPKLALEIQKASQTDAIFAAELNLWWTENQIEHPGCTQFQGMARVNLINWINRILFAHYLRLFNNGADSVQSIQAGTSVQDAITIFDSISQQCDFMNVFNTALGQKYLDDITWNGLIDLNSFLKDIKLDSISQDSFRLVIDKVLTYSRKKLAGQFSTPEPLADLLVRLAIRDRTKPVIDPCCGTGTIARAAYDLKRSVGINVANSLSNTWASDKFAFPLQLCSIALSDPLGMGEVVRVFRHDAFTLQENLPVSFTNPDTGDTVEIDFPVMHAVISNLPFVRFENNEILNPSLGSIRDTLAHDCAGDRTLEGRADLYAYLILKLRELVEEQGRIGVICSNSWLAVEWGRQFKEILSNCFNIRQIVVSGEGRWFSNADVVTTILILEKRIGALDPDEKIAFLTTTNRIETWQALPGGVDQLANCMMVNSTPTDGFTKHEYTREQIQALEAVGLGWNALFADVSWVGSVTNTLVPVSRFFEIKRGERRGWDKMFYPKSGHGIETQYIRPVLKSPRNISGLIAHANGEAFCCSDSIAKLNSAGMSGTLAWILSFQNATNGTGKPLPAVLKQADTEWYEMSPTTLADLVIPMNPDQRLCVHRLNQRSFVNQRLIRLTSLPQVSEGNVDIDLCHALMNSVVGMFLIEAIGFGRGLGALDLNATKLSDGLCMLDPDAISVPQRDRILEAFVPLLGRDVLDLTHELLSADRITFDKTVLQAYGIENMQNQIYDSLRQLFHIRQTART